MSSQEDYAKNQKMHYKQLTKTLERAKAAVAPNYDQLSAISMNYANLVIDNYILRTHPKMSVDFSNEAFNNNLRILDFGCGVGRVMEGYSQCGVVEVDGVDISEEMLEYAMQSPYLSKSNFYLSNGTDLGESKRNHYDIISAFLVMHHIPMRQTRIKIVEAMFDALNEKGMIFLEYKIFPGINTRQIPKEHASWDQNRVAKHTNSRCDVWLTPDELGMLYSDLRLYFKDIFIMEVDNVNEKFEFNADMRYQYGFNSLYVSASKRPQLKSMLGQIDS